jgi:hypothetical protein
MKNKRPKKLQSFERKGWKDIGFKNYDHFYGVSGCIGLGIKTSLQY